MPTLMSFRMWWPPPPSCGKSTCSCSFAARSRGTFVQQSPWRCPSRSFLLWLPNGCRFVTNVEIDSVACGVGDLLGNKVSVVAWCPSVEHCCCFQGGVAISCKVLESSVCFISSHLAARASRVTQRAENYSKIVKTLK
jgi:hypothetical protein